IEFLLLAPDLFVLLVRLIFDGRVGATEKLLLAAAAVYVLIPFDFLPESVLGGTGYLDDAVLMAYVVAQVLAIADPGVLRELWSGRKEMIDRMA
ncbi:MAG TPA: DUF1232 domain-containing protein, partial [Thermoanaerobaculia bacterium]|nr:DUF1232 domain-containing protein [Thermoanaerobaculia bacterium]